MQCSVAANTQTHRILHPRKFAAYGLDASANGVTDHVLSRIKIEGLPFLGNGSSGILIWITTAI